MLLPNREQAVVDLAKLSDYCLNPDHPRGRHKARVFASALGLTLADAESLRATLLSVALDHEATPAISGSLWSAIRAGFYHGRKRG